MDHSLKNAEDKGEPIYLMHYDNTVMLIVSINYLVTIKVKLADEEYHDIVIDWSERSGKYKGKQVIDQLSTIIGIPSHYICDVYIHLPHDNWVEVENIEHKDFNPERFGEDFNDREQILFTKASCLGILNNGDCFVITTELIFCDFEFNFSICLESRLLVNDNDCTGNYCHYSNTRAFINRQVAIAINSELVMKIRLKYGEIPMDIEDREIYLRQKKILRDFDIKPFIYGPWCRLIYGEVQEHIEYINPQYSRTRG
ncbi:uncharacterized protein LOC107367800 [Tetranychus urticae]|uniref:Uncharacterized protein n=1 Tax=Tetranychus urticae TaxID=32264 RepID=T1KW71_TETUR|nr:uncharacterized protein LOC107367800 [Tetranychus urticae]